MNTVIHTKESLPLNLSGRIPELDGLRGLAIGMALMAHHLMIVSPPDLPWPVRSFRYAWTGPALTSFLSSPVSSSEGFCWMRENPRTISVFSTYGGFSTSLPFMQLCRSPSV